MAKWPARPEFPKCEMCGERKVYSLGHPRHRRRYCLDCKAQQDGDNWYTWKQWEILTNCGCCRNRDTEECTACKDFKNWKDDNMESEPVPEDWLPPFWRKKQ